VQQPWAFFVFIKLVEKLLVILGCVEIPKHRCRGDRDLKRIADVLAKISIQTNAPW